MSKKVKDDEERSRVGAGRPPRKASAARSAKVTRTPATAKERPRIRASHGSLTSSLETGRRGEGRPGTRVARAPIRPARPTLDRARPFRAPAPPKKPARGEAETIDAEGARRAATVPKRRSVAPSEISTATKEMAIAIATAGLDKKAIGIEVLDVTGRVDYADYLVIMTGTSDRHVHAIAMGIDEALSKKKMRPLSIEGLGAGSWVLIDFGDVVVHVFQEETRRVYDIEGLWIDARRIEIADPVRPRA